jgi:hypothetical protein
MNYMLKKRRIFWTTITFLLLLTVQGVNSQVNYEGSGTFMRPFNVTGDRIGIWDGRSHIPLFIKGINLGVSVPGTQPGELAATRDDYNRWFHLVKEAGFNAIRLYTLHFPRFYEALKVYNESNPGNPLYVIHGIWLEEQEVPVDLYTLTDEFDKEISEVVSAIHGDVSIPLRVGKAYGNFTADISPWVIGFLIGREIYPAEVSLTNKANPGKVTFHGNYFKLENADPAETWVASRLEYLVEMESTKYQMVRPVGISSWPTLDPLDHPTEQLLTGSSEDLEQIDLANITWNDSTAGFMIGFHAYPYYPDFINQNPVYSLASDRFGPNNYLGYITDLKQHYSGIPLIIAEFGVPTSWGSAHLSPTGMDHGGISEEEQGFHTYRMFGNIFDAGCAGGLQFSLIDEWFKQTWITNPYADPAYRYLWHNLTAPEQNFGILSYSPPPMKFTRVGNYGNRSISKISTSADYTYFRIRAYLDVDAFRKDTLWIALDTYLANLGESVLPNGVKIGNAEDTLRAEFALMIPLGDSLAQLYVIPSYDVYGIKEPVRIDTVISTRQNEGKWNKVRWKTNYFLNVTQYIGELKISEVQDPYRLFKSVSLLGDSLEVRIPWTLLNITAPSKRRVMHYKSFDDNGTIRFNSQDSLTDGIALTLVLNDELYQTDRYLWNEWDYADLVSNPPIERKKQSFHYLAERLLLFNNPPIGWADTYETGPEKQLIVGATDGLLSNDLDLDGNNIEAMLAFGNATTKGNLYLHPDGSFEYTAENNASGMDYFMYYLYDGVDYSTLIPVKIILDEANGLANIKNRDSFRVFPNPASEFVWVETDMELTSCTLAVIDMTGRVMVEKIIDSNEMVPVHDLKPGVYFFHLNLPERKEIHKIMIQ